MGNSKDGNSDLEARARESQRKSERHIGMEFRCDVCGFPHQDSEMKIQHGKRVCASCFEPGGDEIDRAEKRAFSAKYAAQRDASRRLPKYAFTLETAPWITSFLPTPVAILKPDPNPVPKELVGPSVVLIVEGGKLGEVTWTLPTGVVLESNVVSADGTYATLTMHATAEATAGDYAILANGEYYREKIRLMETEMDYNNVYLKLDGTNNGVPLTWVDTVALDAAVAGLVPTARTVSTTAPLTGGGDLSTNRTLGISSFAGTTPGAVPTSLGGTANFLRADGAWAAPVSVTNLAYDSATRVISSDAGADATLPLFTNLIAGLVPLSGGGTANYLRADGTWATPPITPVTDLSYTAATRVLASSTGADATLPLFTATDPGLTPLSGGGTANYLRADGTWAAPPGTAAGTDLSYTAATRLLSSSTGADVTLPLFTSTDAGLVPLSGGGTSAFLRADGTWAAPAGGGDMVLASIQTVTGAKTYNSGKLILAGATSGTSILNAAAIAGSTTLTLPGTTGTLALIDSPTFTGTPAAPTAAVNTNTTQIATTAYVVGQGYAKLAGPTFTGVPAAPTAAADTNTTQIATTAYVIGQGYLKSATASSTYAPLASPALTGNPTAPTPATADNDTSIATTAYVKAQGYGTGDVTLAGAQTFSGQKTSTPAFLANGGIRVSSGGATITKILRGTATLGFGTCTFGTSYNQSFTVTGAAVGDVVLVSPHSYSPAYLINRAWVSSANTVTVGLININSAASEDSSSEVYTVYVFSIA